MNVAIYCSDKRNADKISGLMSAYGLRSGFYNRYYTFDVIEELFLQASGKRFKAFLLCINNESDLMLIVKLRALYKDSRLIMITDNNEYALTSFYIPVDFCASGQSIEASLNGIFKKLI